MAGRATLTPNAIEEIRYCEHNHTAQWISTVSQRVAAVMAVYNRRETTLSCLRLLRQQGDSVTQLDIFVLDDNSTDGTADAVEREFPDARLIRGRGGLYWNSGMRIAYGTALRGEYDYYWWLNDDTQLDPDALSRLLLTYGMLTERRKAPAIIVGSTRDPTDGSLTYGGAWRPDPARPLRFERVQPGDEPKPAETMNGNCVLIPREIAHRVGNVDPAFRHKMGDFDYGFRTRDAGYSIWVAPGTIGTCATHPTRDPTKASVLDELRRIYSVKELPPQAWATFARRYGGSVWPVYFLSPYLRRSAQILAERLRSRAPRLR